MRVPFGVMKHKSGRGEYKLFLEGNTVKYETMNKSTYGNLGERVWFTTSGYNNGPNWLFIPHEETPFEGNIY